MSLFKTILTLLTLWTAYVTADDLSDSIDSIEAIGTTPFTSEDDDSIEAIDDSNSDSESCDDDDTDWHVVYHEKSTQFKIFNPCDDEEFLSLEMSDLTEYDLNDQQTQNKVTFTSTQYQWDTDTGSIGLYEEYKVLQNTFTASNIIGNASFVLTTYLFKEDAVIHNNYTSINKNTLKWNVNITKWPLLSANNYLELCINLTTNRANESDSDSSESDSNDDDDDVHYWRTGDFDVGVFDTAECGSNGILNVNVTAVNVGSNTKKLCFEFDACADGNIFYDPIISYIPSHSPNDEQLITVISRILLIIMIGSIGYITLIVSVCYIYKKKKQGPYQGLLETELTCT